MTRNSLRGLMAEFGIVVPQGPQHISKLLVILADPEDPRIPAVARTALNAMADLLAALEQQVETLDKTIRAQVRANPIARRLDTIPGFGPILSGAIAAIVADPRHFDSGRDFAASLVWCRDRTAPAARSDSARSANAATDICGACW